MNFGRTTPILRIFDEAKAREFYVDFLGFKVDWEHRFEPGLPFYMQVSKDDCVLHLSEHHGDCSPGAAVRIETSDLDGFHTELMSKGYKHARPGVEQTPWGTRELSVRDAFGNRLTSTTRIGTSPRTLGEGTAGGGKRTLGREAGRRQEVGTTPAARTVRAAKKNA